MPQSAKKALLWTAVSSSIQAAEDKISLIEQERALRELADYKGWQVLDVLSVPGHSRSESDILTALDEFAAQKCFAYHKLRDHWLAQDFDLLIAFDSSRFARSQTLFSYVVENVIRSGAVIHLLQGGEVNESNVEFSVALGSVAATSGIRRLVSLRSAAMDKAASQGIPTTNRHNFGYVIIRNEKHRAIRVEVDEAKRTLFGDLLGLVKEGVPYHQLEIELLRRFGHADPKNGRRFAGGFFYRWLHRPSTWGHSVRNAYRLAEGNLWSFDLDLSPPEGVKIWRNTHPPIYTGKDAEDLKAELRRRNAANETIRGRGSPRSRHPFAGLVICGMCGFNMSVCIDKDRMAGKKKTYYYRCHRNYPSKNRTTRCEKMQTIRANVIVEYVDKMLRALINLPDPVEFFSFALDGEDTAQQATRLLDEIKALDESARRVLAKLKDPRFDALQSVLEEDLSQINVRLKAAKTALAEIRRKPETQDILRGRTLALDELKQLTIDGFWKISVLEQNQLLHQILGKLRFKILDHEVADLVERLG